MELKITMVWRSNSFRKLLLLFASIILISCSSQADHTLTTKEAGVDNPSSTSNAEASLRASPNTPTPAQDDVKIARAQNSVEGLDSDADFDVGPNEPNDQPDPEDWKDLPVIPAISDHAKEIYKAGIEAGNNPRAFSKVGDCQNVPSMFLSIFDFSGYYSLGDEYEYLQETIDWYQGSFSRESEAVRRGFNAASVISPVWADPEACEPGESPLDCEIRVNNPSVAIVSLETWWAGNPENYEKYVRQIIEGLLEHNILPIIATKADNLEGNHQINQILVGLAMEYQIPIWNFWRAVQPLPGNGLMQDRFHLTFDENHFEDPDVMKAAWPWRNLTALQVLDRVRSELAVSH
jgi:hypothetical protein